MMGRDGHHPVNATPRSPSAAERLHPGNTMTTESYLASIGKPGRYLGHEFNSLCKEHRPGRISFCLAFPDLYEIGMSHHGLQILYHLLNRQDEFVAERCYCPDRDVEAILRARGLPLTSLESARPLGNFDVLGITLPYELCYSNILTILDLAGIPFLAADRDADSPLVIGGGAGAFNPEPVAPFFDAILLGDGEEAIVEIGQAIAAAKAAAVNRAEMLQRLAAIDGVYVPALFAPRYGENGALIAVEPLHEVKPVRRRVLASLAAIDHLTRPLVPNAKIVHDRLGIEIARGCTRGCRFCQAGITYRPVRERTPEEILRLAGDGIANSGFEELALLSLSTGDYSCLDQVLPQLMDTFASRRIAVAMPSLRVGTLTAEVMEQIKRVRKTGFTLAPEAGSERLRQTINKGISEEELLAACSEAFAAGWLSIKLYFMIGLPGETDDDIAAIARLAAKILATSGKGGGRGKRQITVSVGTFVPKPHTPFQWAAQLLPEESLRRIQLLKGMLPARGCNLRYHSPQQSFLEGVFSRGDRHLATLLVAAWQAGARLDGWDEHFSLERWLEAAEGLGMDLRRYLAAREPGAPLPWSHLLSGVDESFLLAELEKSCSGLYTPDCRYHACQKCGLCDFKRVQPVVCRRRPGGEAPPPPRPPAQQTPPPGHFRYMVHYRRLGAISHLGHLELLQAILRTLRRAGVETHFSQGFHPVPKISFGPALASGTESLAEYFIMDLPSPLGDCTAAAARINAAIIPGLEVVTIAPHAGKAPQRLRISYTLTLPRPLSAADRERVAAFNAATSYMVDKTRKGRTTAIDIRPLTTALAIAGEHRVSLDLLSVSATPGIKPLEAVSAILQLSAEEAGAVTVLKTAWQAMDDA